MYRRSKRKKFFVCRFLKQYPNIQKYRPKFLDSLLFKPEFFTKHPRNFLIFRILKYIHHISLPAIPNKIPKKFIRPYQNLFYNVQSAEMNISYSPSRCQFLAFLLNRLRVLKKLRLTIQISLAYFYLIRKLGHSFLSHHLSNLELKIHSGQRLLDCKGNEEYFYKNINYNSLTILRLCVSLESDSYEIIQNKISQSTKLQILEFNCKNLSSNGNIQSINTPELKLLKSLRNVSFCFPQYSFSTYNDFHISTLKLLSNLPDVSSLALSLQKSTNFHSTEPLIQEIIEKLENNANLKLLEIVFPFEYKGKYNFDSFSNLPSLKKLKLHFINAFGMDKNSLSNLGDVMKKMINLENFHIVLENFELFYLVPTKVIEPLVGLSSLSSLIIHNIYDNDVPYFAEYLISLSQILQKFINLTDLEINARTTKGAFAIISQENFLNIVDNLAFLKNLKRLQMCLSEICEINNFEVLKNIGSNLKQLIKLESLHFSLKLKDIENKLSTIVSLFQEISWLTALRELIIEIGSLTIWEEEILDYIKKLTKQLLPLKRLSKFILKLPFIPGSNRDFLNCWKNIFIKMKTVSNYELWLGSGCVDTGY